MSADGTDAAAAWDDLARGNARMVAGAPDHRSRTPERRAELVASQQPVAAVLACADSRVPVEILFDQGYGDLFVVRTAGPTLSAGVVGSVEYAVAVLGVNLVVVLTHQNCGAIGTARRMAAAPEELPGSLPAVIDGIGPDVLAAPESDAPARHAAAVADALENDSPVVRDAARERGLRVVAATYSLETGAVTALPHGGN